MKYLLDTHILLWALKGINGENGDELPKAVKDILMDANNEIYYSSINIFEIEIKKIVRDDLNLPSGEEVIRACDEAGYIQLDLKAEHTLMMKTLKKDKCVEDHKDPYDWLLVSQAKKAGMKLITHDSKLIHYNETCIFPV